MSEAQPTRREPSFSASVVVQYRNSELEIRRVAHRDRCAITSIAPPPADTHVAIIQLGRLPAHDFWEKGRSHHQPRGGESGIRMFHLPDQPSCRVMEPADNLHFFMPRAALDDLADDAEAPRIDAIRTPEGWEQHDLVIDGLKQSIAEAISHDGASNSLFLDHAVIALHAHLATVYGGLRPRERRSIGGLAPWQERTAKELMSENLCRNVSLAEIAQACKLSPAHFSRAFKVSTSVTPHAWLLSRRIDRAKQLLGADDLSLTEVALSCGFADQSHFTRVFAGATGTTPGAWRRFRSAA